VVPVEPLAAVVPELPTLIYGLFGALGLRAREKYWTSEKRLDNMRTSPLTFFPMKTKGRF
jgi:hypothetical protein